MIKLSNNFIDLTGKIFGRLTVISKNVGKRERDLLWDCVCLCGTYKTIRGSCLRRGMTKSCGCLVREKNKQNCRTLPDGESARNILFDDYRNGAKRRGYAFTLSLERFTFITSQSCYFCGAKPLQVKRSRSRMGDYVYNGIDRLDNNGGYTEENSVACCDACNGAKCKMSEQEFLDWVKRVYTHRYLMVLKKDALSDIREERDGD